MNSTGRWLRLESGACDHALNMALDEALLEAMPRLGRPAVRFYGWTEPAASFGYFQKFAEVEKMTPLRPLVRRPTGGGVVPHAADWTYSLVFPPGGEWYGLTATESYRRAHEWVRAAFARLGVETELAPHCRKALGAQLGTTTDSLAPPERGEGWGEGNRACNSSTSSPRPSPPFGEEREKSVAVPRCARSLEGQCFAGYEKFDVLWRGQKIAGAAQRRRRDGLLVQGSVQAPPLGLSRTDWQSAMCEAAGLEQGTTWQDFAPDAPLAERARELAAQKYSQASYNRKR